jgi:hypothetical protein
MKRISSLTTTILLLVTSAASAEVEVIVASTGPKADIGIGNDAVSFMYSFDLSPDGTWWVGEFELDISIDSVHLRGRGAAPTDILWTEADPAPGNLPGVIRRSNESRQMSVNDSGDVVGLARNVDQGVILGEFVYGYDGQAVSVLAATGEAIPAFPIDNYANFLSPNALSNGNAAFVADNISGHDVTVETDLVTLTQNGTLFGGQQKGVTSYAGSSLQRIDPEQYFVNSAGSQFIFSGDTNGATTEDDIVVVGNVGTPGSVVLQENVTPVMTSQGSEPFDAATRTFLAPNGDWYVSGDTTLSTDLLIRNGEVLANEGDAAPDGFAYVNEPIAFTADAQGNYAWIWQTTNPDADRDTILVYNGTNVLLSEGDTFSFDQDGDGIEEPALIEHLFLDARNLSLGGGHVYLMTEVDEPVTTQQIGWTFIRVPVPETLVCDFDGNAVCDVNDLNQLLSEGPIEDGIGVTIGVNDQFDLNADGILDLSDRDEWLAAAASENGLSTAYRLGDANLDGTVDGNDFLAWNANKFAPSLLWDDGDFNGDGLVDGRDYLAWNANKFTSSTVLVPEPSGVGIVVLGMLSALLLVRTEWMAH